MDFYGLGKITMDGMRFVFNREPISQAGRRGFDPRLPLFNPKPYSCLTYPVSKRSPITFQLDVEQRRSEERKIEQKRRAAVAQEKSPSRENFYPESTHDAMRFARSIVRLVCSNPSFQPYMEQLLAASKLHSQIVGRCA